MSALRQDYLVYIQEHELGEFSTVKRYLWLFTKTTFPIVLFYRLAQHQSRFVRLLCIPVYKILRMISGVQIPRATKIGKGLFLPHYGPIVLNKKAKYGEFLTIYHGVTVGAKGAGSDVTECPTIGNNVRLSTGAIILGDVSIEDNVTVGAGAVVVKSVPPNCIVVGNPAKPIAPKSDTD